MNQGEYCGNTLPTVAAVQQFGPSVSDPVCGGGIYRTRSAPSPAARQRPESGRLTGGQRRMYVQTAVDAIDVTPQRRPRGMPRPAHDQVGPPYLAEAVECAFAIIFRS